MKLKPGLFTSENLQTIAINVMAVSVLLGVFSSDEGEILIELGSRIIAGILALVTTVTYISGRTNLKKAAIEGESILNFFNAVQDLRALQGLSDDEVSDDEVVEENVG